MTKEELLSRIHEASPRKDRRINRILQLIESRSPGLTAKEEFARILSTVYNFSGPTGEELSAAEYARYEKAFLRSSKYSSMLFDVFLVEEGNAAKLEHVLGEIDKVYQEQFPPLSNE